MESTDDMFFKFIWNLCFVVLSVGRFVGFVMSMKLVFVESHMVAANAAQKLATMQVVQDGARVRDVDNLHLSPVLGDEVEGCVHESDGNPEGKQDRHEPHYYGDQSNTV